MKTNNNLITLFIVSFIFLTISGCQHAKVEKELNGSYKSKSISIVDKSTVVDSVNKEWTIEFGTLLYEGIYEDKEFIKGNDLILEYEIANLDPGNTASNVFSFGLAGKGNFKVKVTFLDSQGKVLSIISTEQERSGGLLGGGYSEALKRAAKNIVDYVNDNFAYDD